MKNRCILGPPLGPPNGSELCRLTLGGVWGGHYVYTFTATSQTQYHTTATRNRHRRPEAIKANNTSPLPRLVAPEGAGGLKTNKDITNKQTNKQTKTTQISKDTDKDKERKAKTNTKK